MAAWLAETHAHSIDPGTAVHLSSATATAPHKGDIVTLDGPGFAASVGRVISVARGNLVLQLASGTRFIFRPRREDDTLSGITTLTGEDWVLLLVSPAQLQE